MKHLFATSLCALACFSTFAQVDQPVSPPAQVVSTKDTQIPSVVVPKKGTIAIPAKKPASVVVRSVPGAAAAAPAALNLPLPKSEKPDAQNLPGLGKTPGVIAENKIKSIKVGGDRNERVFISLTQLNKIATPFADPKAIDASGATLKAVGQDLFIKPAGDQPITIYITDGGVGQSVGVTLVPQANLPAQSIVIEPEAPATKIQSAATTQDEMVPSDYVGRLTSHIKNLALGKTPNGFVKSKLVRATATNPQMLYETQHKYVGSTYDIYSYKLTSLSEKPVELSEEAFYTPDVRAVAFFPSAMLQKGENTQVFVIAEHTGGSK